MNELQQARSDWIKAQERILELERENAKLKRTVFETAQAGMNGVMRMYMAVLNLQGLFCTARPIHSGADNGESEPAN